MVVGLLMLAWTAAASGAWWTGQTELAITFTIVALIVLAVFGWEQWVLFSWDALDKRSGAGALRI